jgi:hypothetical protein
MTCGIGALCLSLTEIAPHRFLDIVPIHGEVGRKLFGAVLKALSIVIRDASLPEIRGQGRIQAFRPIKVVNRCGNVPQLERSHPPFDVELGVMRVGFQGSREALDFAGHE